jgi:hypothetical protein
MRTGPQTQAPGTSQRKTETENKQAPKQAQLQPNEHPDRAGPTGPGADDCAWEAQAFALYGLFCLCGVLRAVAFRRYSRTGGSPPECPTAAT